MDHAANLVIAPADPRTDDVHQLLTRHLEFNHAQSPPEDVHALDLEELLDPSVSFFCARREGRLLGMGALVEIDATHAELKSMHTAEVVRGEGVGRAMLTHLVNQARQRGYRRISLETGTMQGFAPARSLYRSVGFEPCEPFGHYSPSPNSAFMTLVLA